MNNMFDSNFYWLSLALIVPIGSLVLSCLFDWSDKK